MDLENKNYYEVLEVSESSSQEEIRQAFKRAKNSYSGDSVAMYSLMSDQDCKKILESIEEAYSILGDQDKRREYDMVRGLNTYRDGGQPQSQVNHGNDETPKAQRERFQQDFGSTTHKEARVSKIAAVNRFALEYEQDPEMEQRIDNATEFNGSFLKEIREYKNVTIERLAELTRISKTHLRHLEDEQFDKLPASVYVRGFVYQYAKSLKINQDIVANSYIAYMKQKKSQSADGL